jgi:putative spermidine/putrescine transport system permease protein
LGNGSTIGAGLWRIAVWLLVGLFVLNLAALIASVGLDSAATRWLGTWLPVGYTPTWYESAWDEFQLTDVLIVTLEVVIAVLIGSALLGVPAAYALARRNFPGKRAALLVFLLPLIVPPFTYGIPLATVLYQFGLGGTLSGVILANLMPAVPFVVFVLVPFIEQIDPRVEAAARVFGAGTWRLFVHVMVPLLAQGILAALMLVLVRTIGLFELTFLTSGPGTQTLVVALYYAVFAAGVRANQSIDAMAVVYMLTSLACLLIALRFVDPTQIVGRAARRAR